MKRSTNNKQNFMFQSCCLLSIISYHIRRLRPNFSKYQVQTQARGTFFTNRHWPDLKSKPRPVCCQKAFQSKSNFNNVLFPKNQHPGSRTENIGPREHKYFPKRPSMLAQDAKANPGCCAPISLYSQKHTIY